MNATTPGTSRRWWRARVSKKRHALGLLLLVLAGVFFYAMLVGGMRFFMVDSISMEPTLVGGDRLVAVRGHTYQRGDIVIVRDPLDGKGFLVKRVIGMPGDVIEIRGGAVFVNDQFLSEPYRPDPIDYVLPRYVVPKSAVFVLGDNSNKSVDSHNWAMAVQNSTAIVPMAVPMDSVIATAIFQYYPAGRIGPIHGFPLSDQLSLLARLRSAQALQ